MIRHAQQRAFTLIELVIVIVLLGIVSTFTFRFVGLGAEMYAEGSERIRILDQSRFAVERLTREMRQAVPNSVRTTAGGAGTLQCIEFVPSRVAGRYRRGPGNNRFTILTFADSWQTAVTDRAFIYATQTTQVYSDSPDRYVEVNAEIPWSGQFDTLITYDGTISGNSPQRRVYIGTTPVSYCVQQQQLIRYAGYGWFANQPTPGNGLTSGVLMAEALNNINSGRDAFSVNAANLERTSTATLYLEFVSNNTEPLFFNHEVSIPNAP